MRFSCQKGNMTVWEEYYMTKEKKEELLQNNLKAILELEYLGARFENATESNSMFGGLIFKYSVPEKSIIEDKEYSADWLKKAAKNALIDMSIETCKADGIWSDGDEEWVKNQIKCYAKVRNGEIWTEEMGKTRVEELIGQIKSAIEYLEV